MKDAKKLIETSQHRNTPHRSDLRTSSTRFLVLRENSERPLNDVDVCNHSDPVYNIAIQNPTAQPGSGAAQVPNHRYDVGDIYGIMDRSPSTPVVGMSSTVGRVFVSPSSQVDTATTQNAYFNGGTRAEGGGLNVYSYGHADGNMLNLKNNKDIRHHDRYARNHDLLERNSVVYTGTFFNPLESPVGSKVCDSVYFVAPKERGVMPPKLQATTLNNKTFVNY
jgi:hypothetical protein